MAGALVFAAATQGTPLGYLALVARGACIPGSYRTVAIGDSSWQAATLRALCRWQTEAHLPSQFSVRKPLGLSRSFCLRLQV